MRANYPCTMNENTVTWNWDGMKYLNVRSGPGLSFIFRGFAMSEGLRKFAQEFVEGRIDAVTFADEFIDRWRQERNSGEIRLDEPQLSEVLSSIFCFSDMFNPDESRIEYELDESQLRLEVKKLLRRLSNSAV